MKAQENRLKWHTPRAQTAYFIAESKGVGKEQRPIQPQDFQALDGAWIRRASHAVVNMIPAGYRTQAGDGQVAGAPDEAKQREHDRDRQPGQYADSNNADQCQHGLPELA